MAVQALHLDPLGALQIRARSDYTALRDEWHALESHAQDPFCGYAWCAAWYQAMDGDPSQKPVVITARDSQGQLLCLLPLVRERKLGVRLLARPGRSISGDFAGVFAPKLRALLNPTQTLAFWRAAAAAARPADMLVLNGVRVAHSSPLAQLPYLPASAPSFAMDLQEDWDAQYQSLFSSKIKRNDRRSLSRLQESGPTQFLRPTDPQAQAQILNVLLEQKRRQIESQGQNHQLSQARVLDFYRALPQLFSQSRAQELVVSALSLDDKLIATSCGIMANERYYGMFMAMEGGDTKKFSPGRLLLLDINRYLCEQGCKVHELGTASITTKKPGNATVTSA